MWRPDCSLDQYFTLGAVSDHLMGLFDSAGAMNILDLGSGGGSLSAAAVRRWSEASITTVDIDYRVSGFLRETLQNRTCTRHVHHVADALDVDLPSRMNGEEFELAICNPPYRRIQWREGFARILSEAGLDDLHAIPKDSLSSEVLFLAQILRLARPGAEIGVIVPDGFVSGLRTRPIREALMRRTDIRRVVELPRGSFRGTEAKAHVLVLRNSRPSGMPISVGTLTAEGAVRSFCVSVDQAAIRLDWAHYSDVPGGGHIKLGDLGAEIARGTISSVGIRGARHAVFHTSDFPAQRTTIELPGDAGDVPQGLVSAAAGDILLARVDRRLETKVCLVSSGAAALSDCVFRIRVGEQDRDAVFMFLKSEAGREALVRTSRGVGARMISKTALLGMEMNLNG
ncbi:N-6 DNA methylase [Agrobacterium sp. NPDC090283]|uniref:N-6 DNA methylase n=1 Tax=Agrobacterium sp. NPDC090283 TaxID=3363920 RepID=UPI00383AD841